MGHESIVYGCILGSRWRIEDHDRLHRMNASIVESLPHDDDWPFLTRSMFAFPEGGVVTGRYRSLAIHFGATLKAVEWDWDVWLAKFERLLRRLFWTDALLHLRTEATVGHHDYVYEAVDRGGLYRDPPSPPEVWTLRGGPRAFDPSAPDDPCATRSWVFRDGVWQPGGASTGEARGDG